MAKKTFTEIIGIGLIIVAVSVLGHWYIVHYPQGQYLLELILPSLYSLGIGILLVVKKIQIKR